MLYAAMGVASHRVWQAGGGPLPLGLYAAQLALNFAWSPLFFKAHNLKAAAVDITGGCPAPHAPVRPPASETRTTQTLRRARFFLLDFSLRQPARAGAPRPLPLAPQPGQRCRGPLPPCLPDAPACPPPPPHCPAAALVGVLGATIYEFSKVDTREWLA